MKKLFLLLLFLPAVLSAGEHQRQSFAIRGNQFLLNGSPFRIFSGEMHYIRIPREYWRDRLVKLRAAGLNTVCTYVFWNAHEPTPGKFDFSGQRDIATFVRTAQEVGLHVILRPGPYVCSEWDLGGLPSWLLKGGHARLRCSDTTYMKAVTRYIRQLARAVTPLQITHGGPIILLQVENEYGSYGNDKEYLKELEGIYRSAGFDVPFYTSDGPSRAMLDAGTLPDALPVINFGGDAEKAFQELNAFRTGIPQMNGEFWCGWFTHWGDKEWGKAEWGSQKKDLAWMLESGKSFNLYMFHGGTNFGWMAGANFSSTYEPDITSYDYDAPLDEAGNPTQKYYDIQKLLLRYTQSPDKLPPLPAPLPTIGIGTIRLQSAQRLFNALPAPVEAVQPVPIEDLDQDYGFVLYRTTLVGPTSGTLRVTELHDYGVVFVDGKFVGTIDRTKGETSLKLPASIREHPTLDILVEAMGRINFGERLADRKGITERVTLNGVTLMHWKIYPLPMNGLPNFPGITQDTVTTPTFYKGSFNLNEVGDTFLDLQQWKKGVVWVNGKNLGRYWQAGPQYDLFVPAPWLRKGRNEIILFDLFGGLPKVLRSFRSRAEIISNR